MTLHIAWFDTRFTSENFTAGTTYSSESFTALLSIPLSILSLPHDDSKWKSGQSYNYILWEARLHDQQKGNQINKYSSNFYVGKGKFENGALYAT